MIQPVTQLPKLVVCPSALTAASAKDFDRFQIGTFKQIYNSLECTNPKPSSRAGWNDHVFCKKTVETDTNRKDEQIQVAFWHFDNKRTYPRHV